MKTIYDIEAIRKILPHNYPFLLIDKVVEITPGKTLTAIKNVTFNEPQFQGHFSAHPIMPGVLMIEAMAQAGGVLYVKTTGDELNDNNWFFLAGVNSARFKTIVKPGDQLKIEIELLRSKKFVWVFQCTATVDGELACSAELLTAKGSIK